MKEQELEVEREVEVEVAVTVVEELGGAFSELCRLQRWVQERATGCNGRDTVDSLTDKWCAE